MSEARDEEIGVLPSSDMLVISNSRNVHVGDVNVFVPAIDQPIQADVDTCVNIDLKPEPSHSGFYRRRTRSLEDQAKLLLDACERISKIFVPTQAYIDARKSLEKHNVVHILGESGDGKTTLLQQLCLDLYAEGYLPIDVSGPDEIESAYNKDTKIFFVCDDPLGGPYLIQNKVDAWVDKGSSLTKIPKYLLSGDVKIAFASRKEIWIECQENLEDMILFREKIRLCSSALKYEEKSLMVEKHFENKATKPSSLLVQRVASLEDVIAFPYSCNMLATLASGTDKIDEEKFVDTFHRPFPFLRKEIRKLSRNEPWCYAILLLVMLSGGSISDDQLTEQCADETTRTLIKKIVHNFDTIDDRMSFRKLQQCAEKLSGTATYLIERVVVRDGKSFVFRHESVFETVAIEYGQKHAEHLLEHCSPGFVVDRFRLKKCQPSQTWDDHVIKVDENHYDTLAKVFTREVIAGNVFKVFSNPAVEDEQFQKHWIRCIEKLPSDARSHFTHTDYVFFFANKKTTKLLVYLLENLRCANNSALIRVIYTAARRRHFNILKLLIENDVPIDLADENGRSALHLAAHLGKSDVLETLLRYDCNVDLEDCTNRKTALHYAADRGHLKVVQTLIRNKANVNQPDKNSRSPLHLAACQGHSHIVSTLLKHGATVDKKDKQTSTPLHFAAEHGKDESVYILLDHGADVNHADSVGKTALHYATKNGYLNTVSILLENCAEEGPKDFWGKSASDYAIDGDHDKIVPLFLETF